MQNCGSASIKVNNDNYHLIMYEDGGRNTLHDLIKLELFTTSVWIIAYVFQQIYDGVACIHSQGLLLTDMKPSNVVVKKQDLRVRLVDFEDVCAFNPSTGTCESRVNGLFPGTPNYIRKGRVATAPRILDDLFAIGIILANMITGKDVPKDADLDDVLKSMETAMLTLEGPETGKKKLLEVARNLLTASEDHFSTGVAMHEISKIFELTRIVPESTPEGVFRNKCNRMLNHIS